MMPISEGYSEPQIDYKQKYKTLKKRLKLLVYEQECFLEELRKAQRKLLKVARDRSFLLDRLIQYEKVDDSSGDSEATASSESDAEGHRDGLPVKRKRVSGHGSGSGHSQTAGDAAQSASEANIASIILAQQASSTRGEEGTKKRSKTCSKKAKSNAAKPSAETSGSLSAASSVLGQMTREELERHLESKQNAFGIEKATAILPMEIFSNDSSNHASEYTGNGTTADDEEEDLIIDVPH